MDLMIHTSSKCNLWNSYSVLRVFFLGLCFYSIASGNHNRNFSIELKDILPEVYDSFQTPKNNGEAAASVSIQIEILNIRSVSVAEMSFIGDIFLYKTWRDARLIYPSKLKVNQVALNPSWRTYLWTPDVYFHNALEGKVQDTIIPYVYLWLRNDSTVLFGARLSLQFSCDMMLHNFPHDHQTCDMIVKSLTHTLNEMDLHWSDTDPLTIGDYYLLPQFDYLTPIATNCTDVSKMGRHGKFACLRGVIKLSRRTGYYVINIYIPTILIVFMSMLTFWIPPDAVPGRVTLGVTSLLTIITKQYQASLPTVSYIVALNVWLSCCIGFVFCSLLEYATVIALHVHNKRVNAETSQVPDKGLNANVQGTESWWSRINDNIMRRIERIDAYNIDRMSRVVFPAAFAFQCICYWAYYAS